MSPGNDRLATEREGAVRYDNEARNLIQASVEARRLVEDACNGRAVNVL